MVKWIVAFFAVGVAAAGVLALLSRGTSDDAASSGGDSLFAVNRSLLDLLRRSDAIVVGRFEGETTDAVSFGSASSGQPVGTREDVVRTFAVQERVRGNALPGSSIEVRETKGVNLSRPKGSDLPGSVKFEPYRLSKGGVYVLFLMDFDRGDGLHAWGPALTPSVAELNNDQLAFISTEAYQKALSESGQQGVPPSFTVSLADVRSLEQAVPRQSAVATEPSVSPIAQAISAALPALLSAHQDTDAEALGIDAAVLQIIREDSVVCDKMQAQVASITKFAVRLGCRPR